MFNLTNSSLNHRSIFRGGLACLPCGTVCDTCIGTSKNSFKRTPTVNADLQLSPYSTFPHADRTITSRRRSAAALIRLGTWTATAFCDGTDRDTDDVKNAVSCSSGRRLTVIACSPERLCAWPHGRENAPCAIKLHRPRLCRMSDNDTLSTEQCR